MSENPATNFAMLKITTIIGPAVALAALSFAGSAQALPPSSPTLASLLLARTCVKEAGWKITDDCAAIHAVVQNRANMKRGLHYEDVLRRYSKPNPAKPWIEELNVTGKKPANWPAGIKWSGVHERRWLAMLEHTRKIVDGKIIASCDPAHWGDRNEDHKRAVNAGWKEITCGDTRNEFWVIAYKKGTPDLVPCSKRNRRSRHQCEP